MLLFVRDLQKCHAILFGNGKISVKSRPSIVLVTVLKVGILYTSQPDKQYNLASLVANMGTSMNILSIKVNKKIKVFVKRSILN